MCVLLYAIFCIQLYFCQLDRHICTPPYLSLLTFLVSIAESFKCNSDMHLGHIQITIGLLFQITQYFPLTGHSCCFSAESLFCAVVMNCKSLCATILSFCTTWGTVMIELENGFEIKENNIGFISWS